MSPRILSTLDSLIKAEALVNDLKASLKAYAREEIEKNHPASEKIATLSQASQSLEEELNKLMDSCFTPHFSFSLRLTLNVFFKEGYRINVNDWGGSMSSDPSVFECKVDESRASFILLMEVIDSNINEKACTNVIARDYIGGDLDKPMYREDIIRGMPLLNAIFNEISQDEAGLTTQYLQEPMPLYSDGELNLLKTFEIVEYLNDLSNGHQEWNY